MTQGPRESEWPLLRHPPKPTKPIEPIEQSELSKPVNQRKQLIKMYISVKEEENPFGDATPETAAE